MWFSCWVVSVAHQAPLSTGFFRQKYWSELPSPSPGDPPDPGIEPASSALQVDSVPVRGTFRKSPKHWYCLLFHSFHGEANFLKFLVHCHPTLHYVHTVKNQSTPRQLYSPSKLYCSTWIFPFQTLLLLIYSFSPLSLISLSNAWFPSANILQHLSS